MRKITLLLIASIILPCAVCHGALIAFFPGFDELIRTADAIVILRIEKRISGNTRFTLYDTYECYIYQTLKGEIPVNQRVRFRLMDARTSFVSPFTDMSTHLVFLTKKRMLDEPTDYRSLEIQGANILISPFGNEKMPNGKTIKEKIQILLARTLEYNKKQYEKEQMFLNKMLEGTENITGTTKTLPEIPVDIRNYLERELGVSSTGMLILIGKYKLTEKSKFGQKDDQVIHVIQQDLFGGRLFWSCLVNLTENKIQILYQATEPDKFGIIKSISLRAGHECAD